MHQEGKAFVIYSIIGPLCYSTFCRKAYFTNLHRFQLTIMPKVICNHVKFKKSTSECLIIM